MVLTGLDIIASNVPASLKSKRVAVLCHAPSITGGYRHIADVLADAGCRVVALFGPQHGLHGETQDNMIEWEGGTDQSRSLPVYSLYGAHRKPTAEMLKDTEILLIDLQDVGARLYTYIWTVKLCMEAAAEKGIPVLILDRPNPASVMPVDGALLHRSFFTFVGGAEIPLCHRLTIGELALWLREYELPGCDLNVVAMEGWNRNAPFRESKVAWVPPSPNMPTPESTLPYPGTVLAEATNVSEGRGTTTPFELIGAPWMDAHGIISNLGGRNLKGCAFRNHNYIPVFHKYEGELCQGIFIHVTNPRIYKPVETALHIFDAIVSGDGGENFRFLDPPYEYEERLMPFDILAGDEGMREVLSGRRSIEAEVERWREGEALFMKKAEPLLLYPWR